MELTQQIRQEIKANQTRPDKIYVERADGKELFCVRLDKDGTLVFEFANWILISPSASNAFTVNIRGSMNAQ